MATGSTKHETQRIEGNDGNFMEFSTQLSESSPNAIAELRINGKVHGSPFSTVVNLEVQDTGVTKLRVVEPDDRGPFFVEVHNSSGQVYPAP